MIDTWLRKRAEVFIKDNDLRVNNWGTCLLYQFYLFGTVLEDEAIVDKFRSSYDDWVKGNLFPNGTTTDLLGRDAFAYHAYDLLFFARLCHLKVMKLLKLSIRRMYIGELLSGIVWFSGNLFCWIPRNILTLNL